MSMMCSTKDLMQNWLLTDLYLKKRYIKIYRDMSKYQNGKFIKLLMLDITNVILEARLKV